MHGLVSVLCTPTNSKRTFMSTMISQYVSCSQISRHFSEYNKKIHNSVFTYVQCLRQPIGTNLCGYYVCDFIHTSASLDSNLDDRVCTQNCKHVNLVLIFHIFCSTSTYTTNNNFFFRLIALKKDSSRPKESG